MVLIGLLVTLLGFLLSVAGLGMASATGARMAMAMAGILLSFAGIFGLINAAYVKTAIWRR